MGNTIRGIIAFIPSNSCQNYLSGDLKEMPIDKMVDLSSMQLRRFPLRVCAFKELVKLYLSDNKLNSLPPELELLQNLQILALDFNNFKVLPQVVCSLKQLYILYLGNNKLKDLPPEIRLLKNLQTLWIESNYLTNLPTVICELTLLKALHAGCNPIRCLPKELKNLKELRSIWMSGSLLSEFPPVLLEMPFLDIIDVDRNGIRFFPSLVHLTNLKLVIYDHNPCQNAPKVAKGVRRVGRWSEETPELMKKFDVETEVEKAVEIKETQPAPTKENANETNENPVDVTTELN
ncbi:leucine-rich repeat-containing 10 [Pelobates cultripes]|uniref:Leucine-rich repeat-containing 10 n=1 Tax=Pelobates cultripes TaxID=61616 RepID=A0AAD1RX05_PELCU|nr:leucine-rich repeat-containing 10 [Pelobates cultripes]